MTHESRKAAAGKSDGLPIDRLAAKIIPLQQREPKDNPPEPSPQGPGSAPLFHPRTRAQALRTATELNAAAARCRTAAASHPGTTGHALNRLAVHYANVARDFFGRADSLPEFGGVA